jgi:hypothetical protein
MLNPSQAHSLFMQQHITREAWLLAAVELLRPLFAAKGFSVSVFKWFETDGLIS